MEDGEMKEYFYYSYYNSAQPKLNMWEPSVLTMVSDRLKWWLSFGISGFLLTDASRVAVGGGTGDENITRMMDQGEKMLLVAAASYRKKAKN